MLNKKRKQNINTEHEHQRERNVKIEKLKFGQFLCHQLNTHNGTKTQKKTSSVIIFTIFSMYYVLYEVNSSRKEKLYSVTPAIYSHTLFRGQ